MGKHGTRFQWRMTRVGRRAGAITAAAGLVVVAGRTFGQGIAGPDLPRIYDAQNAPIVVCFAPGTSPSYVQALTTYVNLRNQLLFGTDYYIANRWSGNQGSHRALSWSFVPDGLMITGGSEPNAASELFTQMDAAFATQGGRAAWINRFQQVFDRYTQLTGSIYTRIRYQNNDWDDGGTWGLAGSTARGDIRISMHYIDGSYNVLAYNYYPSSGDMVLDSADIPYFRTSTNQHRALRNTVAHEHGHGLGLNHVCSADSDILMEPLTPTTFDGPRQDDIRAVQRSYGDPFEPDDSAAAPHALGVLATGAPISVGAIPPPVIGANDANAALCSIDIDGEQDWFSFTVGGATSLTATLTPVGSTYDNSAQQQNGSCVSSSTINARAVADLVLTVYGTNGTTVLAAANQTGAGSAETIAGLSLPGAGTYYIKVSENGTPAESQLYKLDLSAACPTTPVITAPPVAQSAYAGSVVQFAVTATHAVTYQWRKDGTPLSNGGRLSGADTALLTISAVTNADQGSYSVRVSSACATATSAGAALTVVCYANCDGSTTAPVLNIADFSCFYGRFLAGDSYANCDGSTTAPVLNIMDMLCFQSRFIAGCP